MMGAIAQLPNGEPCATCACRAGTEASQSAQTMADFRECVTSGEPFFCHESTAVRDPHGLSSDRHGNRYSWLPKRHWRVCRGWVAAINRKSVEVQP